MPKINFDAASHEYTVDGVTYLSTTQLMKKYGLSVDYGTIPDKVLKQAAKRGNAVHEALEAHIKGDPNMITLFDEVKLFEHYVTQRGIDKSTIQSEEIVIDQNYQIAGTIDVQFIDDQQDVLADFKTTSSLHLDVVAWQLSIYNYLRCKGDLLSYYFKSLKVFHFNNGRLNVKDIYTVDYDAVVALLVAHKNGDPTYTYKKPNKVILPTEETYLTQIVTEIAMHEDALKKLEAEKMIILDKVKGNFKKHKEYAYTNGTIDIKYKDPVTRRSLNQKKAKEFIIAKGGNIDDFMNESISEAKATAKLCKLQAQPGDANPVQ